MNKNIIRTTMYTGGTSPAKMLQARFYSEDCLVYDLEDAVSDGEKDAARLLIYNTLKYQRPEGKYVAVRVNGIYSAYFEEDLEAIVRAHPDAIRIPKVEHAEEIHMVDRKITEIEKKAGLPVGEIQIWCLIESYLGVLNAREIALASPRLTCMGIGAEDLAVSMGARRSKEGWEIFYARNAVVMACREAGIMAHDCAFVDIDDLEGLQKDIELSRTLGFDGKSCVHPKQLDIVNACFTPSAKEIRYALRVLNALKEAEANNTGVCMLDGSMVDKPMEYRSLNILEKAKAAGIDIGGEY